MNFLGTKGIGIMSKIVDNAPLVDIKAAFDEVVHGYGMGDRAREIIRDALSAFHSAPDRTLFQDELVAKVGSGVNSILGWVSLHVAEILGDAHPPKFALTNYKTINGKKILTLKESVAKALV
jgi:hypothetical protein